MQIAVALIIPDEIHGLLRWRGWVRAHHAELEERHFGDAVNPLATPEAERRFYAISENGSKTEIIDGVPVKTWSVWKWAFPIVLVAGALIALLAFRRRRNLKSSTKS